MRFCATCRSRDLRGVAISSARLLVFDLGTSHVAGARFTLRGGVAQLEECGIEFHSADPTPEPPWAQRVAESLDSLIVGRGWTGSCTMVLPSHLTWSKIVTPPPCEADGVLAAVTAAAKEHIPLPLSEVVWCHRILSRTDHELQIMLVAARREAVAAVCEMARLRGLAVERILPTGQALGGHLAIGTPARPDTVILADLGARTTTLVWSEDTHGRVRISGVAGNAITHAISAALEMDYAAAEELKVAVLSGCSQLPADAPPRRAVEQAVVDFVPRMTREISLAVAAIRRRSPGIAALSVEILGGNSGLPGLETELTRTLGLPVRRWVAAADSLSAEAAAAAQRAKGRGLAALTGVATACLSGNASDLNLLPAEDAQAQAAKTDRRSQVLPTVLLLGAMLPPLGYFGWSARSAREDAAEIEGRLIPVRARQGRIDALHRERQQVDIDLGGLERARWARTEWLRLLGQLEEIVGSIEGVWLERLSVDRTALPAVRADPVRVGQRNVPIATERGGHDAAGPASETRLRLAGRVVELNLSELREVANRVGRVKALFQQFQLSPLVARIESERFDPSREGVLGFEVTLVLQRDVLR